jgi:hypothetical protein
MATQRISHTARLPVCGVPARASLSPPHAATSPSSRRAALGSFSTRPHLVLASTPAPRADLVNRYLVVMGLSPTKKATTTTRSSLPREQGLRGRARHRLQVRHGLAAKGRRHRYMRPPPLLHQATVVATRATVAGAGADATCGRDRCYIRPPSMLQQVAALATRTTVVAPMLRAVAAIATRTIAMAPMPSPLLHTSGAVATRATVAAPMLHAAAAVATRATAVVPMLHAAATAIYAGNHGESYGRRQLGGLALLRTSAMLLSNANGGGAAVRCVVLVSRRRASRVAGDATRQGWWCRRRVVLWA